MKEFGLPLLQRLSRNIRFKLIAEGVSRLFSLIFFLILAHALGDAGYGHYAFPLAFAGLFLYFSDCGLNTLLIRQLAHERHETSRYLRHLLPLKALLSLLTLALILGTALLSGLHSQLELLFWASLITLAQGWLDTLAAIFNGLEEIEREITLRLQNRLLTLGATLLLLCWTRDIRILLQGLTLSWLISLLWASRALSGRINKQPWEPRFALSLLKAGLPFWLSGLFALLYFRMDVAMLWQLGRPAAEVGWYQAVVKLLDILILLPNLILTAIYPVLSSLSNRTDIGQLISHSLYLAWRCVLPLTLGGCLLAPAMIPALLGPAFAPAVPSWQILLWSLFFVYFNHVSLYSLAAVHCNGLLAWSNAAGVVINGILNLLWIPSWGLIGASYSTVLTEIAVAMFNLWALSRILSLEIRPLLWMTSLLSSLGMALLILALQQLGLYWWLILPLAILGYFGLLWASRGLSVAEKDWLLKRFTAFHRPLGA